LEENLPLREQVRAHPTPGLGFAPLRLGAYKRWTPLRHEHAPGTRIRRRSIRIGRDGADPGAPYDCARADICAADGCARKPGRCSRTRRRHQGSATLRDQGRPGQLERHQHRALAEDRGQIEVAISLRRCGLGSIIAGECRIRRFRCRGCRHHDHAGAPTTGRFQHALFPHRNRRCRGGQPNNKLGTGDPLDRIL